MTLMRYRRLLGLSFIVLPASTLPAAADSIDDRAQTVFEAIAPDICSLDGPPIPEVFRLTYEPLMQPGKAAAIRIYRFPCSSNGFFVEHVYLSHTAAAGTQLVAFAQPNYDISCANGPTNMTIECATRVDGFGTLIALPNSTIDPETGTITACRHWLPAPCSLIARIWVLRDGRYVLTEAEGLPPLDADTEPTGLR